jgi:uncharacterized protein (TIGR02145 family)
VAKIGDQVWMADNLATTRYNDGSSIPLETNNNDWINLTTPAYCWYDNDASHKSSVYGALYNWYTVSTGRLCPTGWHVPSSNEWTILQNYLIENGYNYDGTTSENKIAKSMAASTGWNVSSNVGVPGNSDYPEYRNKSNFTAFPAGARLPATGEFYRKGWYANWWSTSQGIFTDDGANWQLSGTRVELNSFSSSKKGGVSIRCIKD